jgi:hypothetical protein
MAKRDILSVACKILGLYVLLRAMGTLPLFVSMMIDALTYPHRNPVEVARLAWSLNASLVASDVSYLTSGQGIEEIGVSVFFCQKM